MSDSDSKEEIESFFREVWDVEARSVLEVEVMGKTYTFKQAYMDTNAIGSHVWESAVLFVEHYTHLLTSYNDIDLRILELGSGIGFTGRILADQGLSLLCSDQASILPLLEENLQGSAPCCTLDWSHPTPLPSVIEEFEPTVLLACDCLYNPSLVPLFLQTVQVLFNTCSSIQSLLVVNRERSKLHQTFIQLFSENHFRVEHIDTLHASSILPSIANHKTNTHVYKITKSICS